MVWFSIPNKRLNVFTQYLYYGWVINSDVLSILLCWSKSTRSQLYRDIHTLLMKKYSEFWTSLPLHCPCLCICYVVYYILGLLLSHNLFMYNLRTLCNHLTNDLLLLKGFELSNDFRLFLVISFLVVRKLWLCVRNFSDTF